MEVSGERVTGSGATGDRKARPKWEKYSIEEEDFEDYEPMFKAFIKRLMSSNGGFKIGGNLAFEFAPKVMVGNESLISPETAFAFHRMEEGVVYKNENNEPVQGENRALDGYNYQKNMPPIEGPLMDNFMPVI